MPARQIFQDKYLDYDKIIGIQDCAKITTLLDHSTVDAFSLFRPIEVTIISWDVHYLVNHVSKFIV